MIYQRKAAKFRYEQAAAGEPVLCKVHGEHLDWYYSPANKRVRCRPCLRTNTQKKRATEYISHRIRRLYYRRPEGFNLTKADFEELFHIQKGRCALTGDLFGSWREATVDRIDSSLGYTRSNVQLVTRHANVAKWTLNQNDFLEFCQRVIDFARQRV